MMLIFTTKLTKKKRILGSTLLAALLLLLLLIFLHAAHQKSTPQQFQDIATNDDRLRLLASIGWETSPEALSTLDLLLPDPLDQRYQEYNALQLSQGFDLSRYCGKRLTRYTYAISNYPDDMQGVQADLYFYENTLVAADLIATGANGFIAPLFPT